MIEFYSGTPGSGKSLDVAKDIWTKIRISKGNVITNMDVNYEYLRRNFFKFKINDITMKLFKKKVFKNPYLKNHGKLYKVSNDKLTVDFLLNYAKKFHKKGVEAQTLVIWDEAQMVFSPTVMKLKNQEDKHYRVNWLNFFTKHRHLGFNIIMISQFDRLIDAQVRCLFEYDVIHRKANNFFGDNPFTMILSLLFGLLRLKMFVAVTYWYGIRQKLGARFFLFNKKYAKIYDSYKYFEEFEDFDSNSNNTPTKSSVLSSKNKVNRFKSGGRKIYPEDSERSEEPEGTKFSA